MNGAQGGLLMILAAVVLFVLWQRGYLASWVGGVTASLSGTSTNKPLNSTQSVSGRAPSSGLGKVMTKV